MTSSHDDGACKPRSDSHHNARTTSQPNRDCVPIIAATTARPLGRATKRAHISDEALSACLTHACDARDIPLADVVIEQDAEKTTHYRHRRGVPRDDIAICDRGRARVRHPRHRSRMDIVIRNCGTRMDAAKVRKEQRKSSQSE